MYIERSTRKYTYLPCLRLCPCAVYYQWNFMCRDQFLRDAGIHKRTFLWLRRAVRGLRIYEHVNLYCGSVLDTMHYEKISFGRSDMLNHNSVYASGNCSRCLVCWTNVITVNFKVASERSKRMFIFYLKHTRHVLLADASVKYLCPAKVCVWNDLCMDWYTWIRTCVYIYIHIYIYIYVSM